MTVGGGGDGGMGGGWRCSRLVDAAATACSAV